MSGFRVDFPVTTIVRFSGSDGSSLVTVDGRTARQWIDSAMAYCDWRSGDSWRRLSNQKQRYDADRLHWLECKRVFRDLFYSSELGRIHPALPVLNPAPTPSPEEIALRGLPRRVLAAALVSESGGRYTDFKLLSHLSGLKLASMLAELRAGMAGRMEKSA